MSDTVEQTMYNFPASVQVRATDDALLKELKKRVGESTVEAGQPYFWRAMISNTTLDSHFTKMAPSSLKNYAKDARDGVAFQDSHSTRSIANTLGRSLTGEYTPLDENKYASVVSDFYTFRGVDPTIDSFITRVEIGLADHVSIGFSPGKFICSICKRDMLSWNMDDWEDNCWHYKGFSYAVEKNGPKVLCTASVEDSRLLEVSTVYYGSTPGAEILRAQRLIEHGKMSQSMARVVEDRYQVRLLNNTKLYLPATINQEDRMGEKPTSLGDATVEVTVDTKQAEEVIDKIQRETNVDPIVLRTHDGIRDLLMSKGLVKGDLVESVRALIDDNTRLAPLADEGKAYRKDLMETALVEGVRAFGDGFQAETYRGMLDSLPLDAIKRMRDDWKSVADKIIPTGRRTSNDGSGEQPAQTEKDPQRYKA